MEEFKVSVVCAQEQGLFSKYKERKPNTSSGSGLLAMMLKASACGAGGLSPLREC
jgi:hypothetical protein